MIVVGQQEGALIIVLGNCGGSRWGKDNQRAKEGVHFLHSSMPMPEIGPWLLHHLPHTGGISHNAEGTHKAGRHIKARLSIAGTVGDTACLIG